MASMTLRHAPALALVVWCLMVPPYHIGDLGGGHQGWIVSYDEPFSKWTVSGRFNSFDECHEKWVSEAMSQLRPFKDLPRKRWHKEDYDKYVALRAFLSAQCD